MSDADLSYQVFAGLLAAVLEDERISPDERERLDAYREKHRITDAQQSEALAALGWTDAQFAEKLTEGEELEAYGHVLQAALADDKMTEAEEARLAAYRKRHKVSRAMHRDAALDPRYVEAFGAGGLQGDLDRYLGDEQDPFLLSC